MRAARQGTERVGRFRPERPVAFPRAVAQKGWGEIFPGSLIPRPRPRPYSTTALDPASVETNIVIFELNGSVDAVRMLASLLSRGDADGCDGAEDRRAVTHLDVGAPKIDQAIEAAACALKEATR